jgi:hypothetical protein
MSTFDFEWTFSTRVRERACKECGSLTPGYLTNIRNGVRKPLCSTCFFAAVKQVAPSSAPREMEQLRLC